jgi:hypothetical protein
MNTPSFAQASEAFSTVLRTIPIDQLPEDLVQRLQEHDTLPEVWGEQWDAQHAQKRNTMDTVAYYVEHDDVSGIIQEAEGHRDEHNHFIVKHMVGLLTSLGQEVPRELSGFLEKEHGGLKEAI